MNLSVQDNYVCTSTASIECTALICCPLQVHDPSVMNKNGRRASEMEDAVYHAMKDRRKQLERSSESRHSCTHARMHTHTTHACMHTKCTTKPAIQLEADSTLNYVSVV